MDRLLTHLICLTLTLGLIPANAARAELVGWWTFNEGEGTIAADSSGGGHDGTINGTPTWQTGQLGGALSFDGAANYVMCDLVSIDTSVTGGLTVCGWINRPAGGDHKLCSNRQVDNAAGGGFTCAVYNDFMEMDISNAAARVLARDSGGKTLPVSTWVHVAWVFDDAGDLVKEYHDGVMVDSDPVTISIGVSTAPFRIGGDSPNVGIYYLGLMDDWRVYDHALTESEIRDAMTGKGPYDEYASKPGPADQATDVVRETGLSWTPSKAGDVRDVYFGTVQADVDAASRDNPGTTLVSRGQAENACQPATRLEFGQTYFWRIDEVNTTTNTIYKGRIWSFTVEAASYPIENVTATASGSGGATTGPEKTVDGSGLNAEGRHSTATSDMWVSDASAPGAAWIQYAFDAEYKLDKLRVWNSNQLVESFIGFGVKSVTIAGSLDGQTWTSLGDVEFAQATASEGYAANTTVDLAGAVARYVKLTINSNWGGMVSQYSLSEVRFLALPMLAREPDPAPGAADVDPQTTLSWRAGREAGSHLVYLSTDQQAVIDGTAAPVTTSQAEADATVDLGQTYYWKVVEVNDAKTPASWAGPVWSFSTKAALVVDDFESYTNTDGGRIYQAWIDGWDTPNTNGAVVGYSDAPFAEQTIVYGGAQSMPLVYNNSPAASSQAERTFDEARDWSQYGVKTLSLAFYGASANSGRLYLTINSTKVAYPGSADDLKRAQWQQWNIDLASTGANLAKVTKLAIGIEGAGASGMLYIDDIRLFPREAELVTPVDPGTDGLLAWYKFDGDMKDSVGTHHGTAVGDAKIAADATRGQVLVLDGVGDAVDVPPLGNGNAVTIAMWVDATVDPTPTQFFSFFNSDGWDAGDLHWRYSYGKVNGGLPSLTDLSGTGVVTSDQWNHVAVTISDTEWALWLNGCKEASRTLTAVQTLTLGDGLIGAWLNGTSVERPFTGMIDDVRFYNRALSQAEIASLAGRTEPFPKPF
ncbi:MAG: LamG-like jellyroll fold domain-containing protein [Solirubrobacterales bacterium]